MISRSIDRGLKSHLASGLVKRLGARLNRTGRLAELQCALSTALVVNNAPEQQIEAYFKESRSASARRFAEMFLAFPLRTLGPVWTVPWRWEDHPDDARRVLHVFGEFLAALALGSPSRHFTELTREKMPEEIARRSRDAWRVALNPTNHTVLLTIVEHLTDEEVQRLLMALLQASLARKPENGIQLAELFLQPKRGLKGPMN